MAWDSQTGPEKVEIGGMAEDLWIYEARRRDGLTNGSLH